MRNKAIPTYKIVQIAVDDFKIHNVNFKKGELWLVTPYRYDNEKYTLISRVDSSGKIVGKNPSMNIYRQEVNHINYIEDIKQIEHARTLELVHSLNFQNKFDINKCKLIKK